MEPACVVNINTRVDHTVYKGQRIAFTKGSSISERLSLLPAGSVAKEADQLRLQIN